MLCSALPILTIYKQSGGKRLEVDKEKARAIAQEINEQVFPKKLRDSLRKIHNMREEEERNVGHSRCPTLSFIIETIFLKGRKDHTKESSVPDIMRGKDNRLKKK